MHSNSKMHTQLSICRCTGSLWHSGMVGSRQCTQIQIHTIHGRGAVFADRLVKQTVMAFYSHASYQLASRALVPGRRGEELAEEKGKQIDQLCLFPSLSPATRQAAAVGMEGELQHGAGPVAGSTEAASERQKEGDGERKRRKHKELLILKGFWRDTEGAPARLVAKASP